MAQQNITDVSFDIAKFDAQLQHIIEGFEKIFDYAVKVSDLKPFPTNNGSTSELKKQATAMQELIKQKEKFEAVTLRQIKIEEQAAKAKAASIKADTETIKAARETERVKQEKLRTAKAELTYEETLARAKAKSRSEEEAQARVAIQVVDERKRMNAELRAEERLYFNVANAMGEASIEAETQKKKVIELRTVIERLDNNIGNFQKNVGNYKSAFDGLGFSFTQVARELPSLAINAQTFFLAISNNLPMVFDEMKKARAEITALKEQGKEAPSLGKRIFSSILSFNVLISAAIALFTAYSGEIVKFGKDLFNIGDSAEETKKKIEALTESIKELDKVLNESDFTFKTENSLKTEDLQRQLNILQSLGASQKDVLTARQKLAQQELDNTDVAISGYKNLNFVISEYKREIAETDSVLSKLTNDFADFVRTGPLSSSEKDIETYNQGVKEFTDKIASYKEEYRKLTGNLKEYYDKRNAVDTASNELAKYNAEQRLLLETETEKNRAQIIIDQNERILSDDRKFEKERDQALIRQAEAQKRIALQTKRAVIDRPDSKNLDGTFTAEAKIAIDNYNKEIKKIDNELADKRYDNFIEFRYRRLAAELELYKASAEYAAANNKQISESEAASFDERIDAYAAFYYQSQELLRKDYEYQKETKVRTTEEQLALDAEYYRKLKELAQKSKKEISDIIVSNTARQVTSANLDENLNLSKEELRLYKSLKNKAKFQEEADKLERKRRTEALNDQIFVDKEIVRSSQTTAEAKQAANDRIKANLAELNKLELEGLKTSDAQKKAAKELKEQIKDQFETLAVETFFSLAEKLSDRYYQKRFDQINKERQLLDERYSAEIDAIKNSTLSEQEKAAKITLLTAQQAAQKQLLDNKEKQENIKKARTEKAITIAKIIAETALAVVKALPNYVLAALAAATGAAQLAVAAAAPIPAYGDGTDDHKGGPAWIGERREPELVSIPGKAPFVVDQPTLFERLPIHTRVTPLKVDEAMSGSMIFNIQERKAVAEYAEHTRKLKSAIISSGSQVAKAIGKNRPVVIIKDSGYERYIDKVIRGRG